MACFPTSPECWPVDHSPALVQLAARCVDLVSHTFGMVATMTAETVLEFVNDAGVVLFGLAFVGFWLKVFSAVARSGVVQPKPKPYLTRDDISPYPVDNCGRWVEPLEVQNFRIREYNRRHGFEQ